MEGFNEEIRRRTTQMSADVFELANTIKGQVMVKSAVQQLLRCSASVAANYRAATRARSDKEFYAKICIVTEECDETLFWIDYLLQVKVLSPVKTQTVRNEVESLVKLFSSTRRTLRGKFGS